MFKLIMNAVLAVCILLVSSCTLFQAGPHEVIKSDSDQRNYRYIVLPNQLKVLLVSDPETKKAAVALDVAVGSRHDPVDRQGLAHFLEHMLFLGTQKYPDASEYGEYLNAHGGSHNAFTAFEHTNYFFDVESTQLEPMLDRFSQFFIAPLFTAKYVNREKNAVHSEYMARIRDDGRRQYDVLREVINPQHPLSNFSVGSLQTLTDRPGHSVRDDLLTFYAEHYSANRMTLVVLGNEPLDQLQAMVESRFDKIPNKNHLLDTVTDPLLTAAQTGKYVEIKSLTQARSLDFTWPLPDQRQQYRSKAISTIANIIGHEGKGSLLSWLKKNGLAERLSAGEGMSWQGGTTLSVSIDLTERGEKEWQTVAGAVYQTIAMLKKSGSQEQLFDEQRLLSEQHFRFMEQGEPIEYVSNLAGNLQEYPAEDVLRGPYRQDIYNPELINELLAQLTPDNAITILSSPTISGDRTSRYYHAPYRVAELPLALRQQWAIIAPNPAISLPKLNPFVAENLTVYPIAKPVAVPQLQTEKPGFDLWYRQSSEFPFPKGDLYLALFNPEIDSTPRNAVLSQLLASLINDQLAEFSYPAYLAGLSYSVGITGKSLTIGISGYNDKQQVLLSRVLDSCTASDFDQARFELLKADLQRALANADKKSPYQLIMRNLPTLLAPDDWTETEQLEVLKTITLADVKAHQQQLRQAVHVRMLLNGNYDSQQRDSLATLVEQRILTGAKTLSVPQFAVAKLPAKSQRFAVPSAYEDAALGVYLQADTLDKNRRAAMGVSVQILKTAFFASLRTEQQLGYIVMATPYPQYDVPGMIFLVQSPVADSAKLDKAVDEFLRQWRNKPKAGLVADFARHRQALMDMLAEKPKNLGEQTQLFWGDLFQGYRQFNSRELLINALQSMTFDQWYADFQQDVLNNPHRLAVYVTGKQVDSYPAGSPVTLEMQRKAPVWLFP